MASILYFDVGGRPYNSQDFAAIQSQVVDATQVYNAFNNGGNYVIQGCVTLGASGTVWIAGHVRAVQTSITVNGATPYPVYIINQDSIVSRVYQDGNAKTAFNVYEAIWTATPPTQGVAFIAFNNVNDLNNTRLSAYLKPNSVPTTGGTFTGTINVNGLGGVTTNGGLGGDLIPQTSAADNGRYRMGLGTNLTWNGNSWVSLTDGAHNGSAIMYSDIFGSLIAFGLYPSNGTSNRLLTPTDIDNGVKMYIDTNGNLNVNGNVSTTVGNVNGANLNATNAVSTNTINMSKKQISSNYGISTINFAAEVNDPGFITHEENNNASIMKFSVSDDASGDYFSWGSTPSGTYTEAMRLVTSGAATLNGAWTANDFVIPSDRTLKQNITDVTNGLEIVESLKPVEFDMIKNSTHKSGFIAQDVLQVLPHAVSQSEDGLYKLSEHQIIPYLVDAIQKLNKRLKELEK